MKKIIYPLLSVMLIACGDFNENLLMWSKAFKYSDPDRGKENLNSPTTRYIGFNIHLTL